MSSTKPRIKPRSAPPRQQREAPVQDSPRSPERDPPVFAPRDAGRKRHPPGEASREKVQDQLDQALADSFPASDPVSIVTSQAEEDWGEDQGAVSSSAKPA